MLGLCDNRDGKVNLKGLVQSIDRSLSGSKKVGDTSEEKGSLAEAVPREQNVLLFCRINNVRCTNDSGFFDCFIRDKLVHTFEAEG